MCRGSRQSISGLSIMQPQQSRPGLGRQDSFVAGGAGPSTLQDMINAGTFLLTAIDTAGNTVFFLCQGQRIAKVYNLNEHVEKALTTEQLLCTPSGMSVLLNSGDLRYFEFVQQDEVINLTDIPMSV